MGLRILTIALLVMAMSRPQTGRRHTQVSTEGIDIVLVLDTSGSMQALDLDADRPINQRRHRLDVAKTVVEEFVQKRQSDQIGLVVFGDEAFTQCPLTLDHGIVATFLEQVDIGMAGDATAIGSALGTAVKRLRDSQAKSKVIILLTDGRNNAGALSPKKAAEIAETFDIKIYAVERTGGAYFRAEDTSALASIYTEIDELETTEITSNTYMEYNERFRFFVLPAVALLLFEVVLLGTRFRKLP
jgi:Ca-activated chloride channel family protein